MSWVGVVTDAGVDLFAQYAQGGMTLEINSVKTGTGTMSQSEMHGATQLVSEVGTGIVESKQAVTNGTQFRIRVGAATASEGTYTMKEIGLFVTSTVGGSQSTVMVAYFMNSDGIGVPLASNFPDFAYILSAVLAMSNDVEISLTVPPSAYVSYTEMKSYVDEAVELMYTPGVNHNNIYRGKNLGTITSENIAEFVAEHEIYEGNFKDLYLGDYFVIHDGTYNKEWMIAAFDWDYGMNFYYNDEDNGLITNHTILIIPRSMGLLKAQANDTADATGGQHRSTIYSVLEGIGEVFEQVLGDYMHYQYRRITNCNPTTRVQNVWVGTSRVPRLLSWTELMVYTDLSYNSLRTGNTYFTTSIKRGLLPIYRYITPDLFFNNPQERVWIDAQQHRDDDTTGFCVYRTGAVVETYTPTEQHWVLPMIAICGIAPSGTRGGRKGGRLTSGDGREIGFEEYDI